VKAVPLPGRLIRRSSRHARRQPNGNAGGDITAADHTDTARLALQAHEPEPSTVESAGRAGDAQNC